MIIAELCGNHNGDFDLLRRMVDEAAKAGATACKIQSFFAEDLSDDWKHEYDRIKSLEFSWDQQAEFVTLCKEKNVIPITSIYSDRYLLQLNRCGFQYLKIGSAQADDSKLLSVLIATGFKVIVSTGGHDLKSLPKLGPLACVMHCVSVYPTHPEQANLSRMFEIKRSWPNTPYGFSSHIDPLSNDWAYPLELASYLGATFIEVHFSLLDRNKTKDGPVSISAGQLRTLCQFDALDSAEKLKRRPDFGYFKCPQSNTEMDVIRKYKGRWKS